MLFGSAAREPDRRGLFSFLFSTFALVDIIQSHFALNLCVCHGSIPIYDVVCVRSYGFVALLKVAVSLSRGGHFSLDEIERRAGNYVAIHTRTIEFYRLPGKLALLPAVNPQFHNCAAPNPESHLLAGAVFFSPH